jgi:hypothetical protein
MVQGEHLMTTTPVTEPTTPVRFRKESRRWRVSDEAVLLFTVLAARKGLKLTDYLEELSRMLAQEQLSPEQLADIAQKAEALAAQRHQAATQAQD